MIEKHSDSLSSKRHRAEKAIHVDTKTLNNQVVSICLIMNQSTPRLDQSEQSWITLSDTQNMPPLKIGYDRNIAKNMLNLLLQNTSY